jgi:hypothetical protein
VAILIWSTWLHLIYFFHNWNLECSPARVQSPMAGQAQIPVPRQARAYRRTAAKAILFVYTPRTQGARYHPHLFVNTTRARLSGTAR